MKVVEFLTRFFFLVCRVHTPFTPPLAISSQTPSHLLPPLLTLFVSLLFLFSIPTSPLMHVICKLPKFPPNTTVLGIFKPRALKRKNWCPSGWACNQQVYPRPQMCCLISKTICFPFGICSVSVSILFQPSSANNMAGKPSIFVNKLGRLPEDGSSRVSHRNVPLDSGIEYVWITCSKINKTQESIAIYKQWTQTLATGNKSR